METTDRKDDAPENARCPKCGSADVRPSKHEGLIDAVLSAFGRSPVRCRSCRHRFYVRLADEAEA